LGLLGARPSRPAGSSERGPEALAGPLELPARHHREHCRWSTAVHHRVVTVATAVVAPAVVTAAGMRSEHESGEEDHGDDEDDARDDADPGGHEIEAAAPAQRFTLDRWRRRNRWL